MFQLQKTIISEDIFDNEFVCNLNSCKGECCVAGEAGAPVTAEEKNILKEIFPKITSYLRPEGIAAIKEQGTYTTNPIGDYETTLINGKECSYAIFDKNNIAKCGIEEAYNAGVISFKKPISCHLYPIRVQEYSQLTAVNYHSWPICNEACALGEALKVPTYKFVKEALIRRFGEDWYTELEQVADEYFTNRDSINGIS